MFLILSIPENEEMAFLVTGIETIWSFSYQIPKEIAFFYHFLANLQMPGALLKNCVISVITVFMNMFGS